MQTDQNTTRTELKHSEDIINRLASEHNLPAFVVSGFHDIFGDDPDAINQACIDYIDNYDFFGDDFFDDLLDCGE